jgi:hypothetical protein
MSSSYTHTDQVLFPNAIPESLDNFEYKKKSLTEGLTIADDAELNNAMSSLMTEFVKDTKNAETKNTQEGMLTGTSMNMNLLQGDLLNYSRNDINKNPIQPFTEQLQTIDEKAGVVSYKEGLTNDVVSSSKGVTTISKSQKMIDLETKLSMLTTEYTTQYRLYTDDLLTRSQFLQTNTQYLNKVIRDVSYSGVDANVAYYYVNPFGYTHRYKDKSAISLYDSTTCPKIEQNEAITDVLNPYKLTPSSFIDISGGTTGGGFSRFSNLKSYDMAGYTPCISAKNVRLAGPTNADDKYAWVDVEGRKHIYSAGVWPDKRHSTCLTAVVGEPIVLTANQYNSIPTAENEPMKENSECFRLSVSPSIHTKLTEIKKNIDITVEEIKKENQNILNGIANSTIFQNKKTTLDHLDTLDDDILAKIKSVLGDYYYPAVYLFWGFIILIAILMIFKFSFMFITPSEGSGANNGSSSPYASADGGGANVSLLGVVIMALIVIFAIYYYFSYTYNLNTSYTIT